MAQTPALPYGSPTVVSGLAETFSFHSSPESFITSRVLAFRTSNPELAQSRTAIRARVLNRNVAVLSSYHQVRQCLCDEGTALRLGSSKAYDELMAPFFPAPNLLLSDPPTHYPMKEIWSKRMATLPNATRPLVQDIVLDHFRGIAPGSSIDLYDSMKRLSWKLLLAIFLSDNAQNPPSEQEATEIESLQEQMLRGQFSLLPVSVNARIWRSPRSKGLEARRQLQSLFASRAIRGAASCPFATPSIEAKEDVASHLLLFTSSLAAKASASLLTAVMMNLFFFKYSPTHVSRDTSYAARIMNEFNETERSEALRKVIHETERLSPPVVGIMRRATEDIVLKPSESQNTPAATLIPKGWDLWLYFVGAARDPAVFGEGAESFEPWSSNEDHGDLEKEGFSFGAGHKSCLGRDLMRQIAMTVAGTCLGIEGAKSSGQRRSPITISSSQDAIPNGVQAWLGWRKDVTPKEWAKDMKQLPTQRPLKPMMVNVTHCLDSV